MKNSGFTLLEVLIAVAILSIAIAGLLTNFQSQIKATKIIQDRIMQHWIGKQGLAMVKLGLIDPTTAQQTTQKTILFGKTWYWRIKLTREGSQEFQKITILTNKHQSGEFKPIISGYYYAQ
jgi:general secretion pathway protein I